MLFLCIRNQNDSYEIHVYGSDYKLSVEKIII